MSVTSTELKLPGIQHDWPLGMTFNSLLVGATSGPGGSAWQGGGGYGWSTRLGSDLRVNLNPDSSVTYFAEDGQQGRFVPSTGSSYTAPVGFKAGLVKTGATGWTLRDHTSNEVITFNAAGKVTAITDRNGQATTFAYAYGWVSHIVSTRSGTLSREADVTTTAAGVPRQPGVDRRPPTTHLAVPDRHPPQAGGDPGGLGEGTVREPPVRGPEVALRV